MGIGCILNNITHLTHFVFMFMFMFIFILILILVLMFILILLLDFFQVDFRLENFLNTVCIPYFYYNKKWMGRFNGIASKYILS